MGIKNVDVTNYYLTSPHKADICMVRLQKSEKLIDQLEVLKKLLRASGGKAKDKDKENWQIWYFMRDIRYLEEGIDAENKHFQECSREEAFFWDCQKDAEAIVPNEVIKAVTGKQRLVGEHFVGDAKDKTHKKRVLPLESALLKQGQQKTNIRR